LPQLFVETLLFSCVPPATCSLATCSALGSSYKKQLCNHQNFKEVKSQRPAAAPCYGRLHPIYVKTLWSRG